MYLIWCPKNSSMKWYLFALMYFKEKRLNINVHDYCGKDEITDMSENGLEPFY